MRVRITPADVGSRVSVRSQIHEPGQPPLTDTVGQLESWGGGVLAIRRRDGTLVELDEAAVVAARVVPPRPG